MRTFNSIKWDAMSSISEELKWARSLSAKIFDVGEARHSGFEAFWMPMSNSMFKRIWPDEIRATVFHVTDDVGYEKVKRMQNKKKGMSAFFEMRGKYFEQGIQTHGGVVMELDANVLGAFNQDVMSAPDTSGRRWIRLQFMKGRWGEKDLSRYQKGIQDLIGALLNKYWRQVMNHPGVPKGYADINQRFQKGLYYKHWMNLGMMANEHQKKTLYFIIKDYIDGIEAIYKQNEDHLREILTNYLQSRRTDEAWDEIIVNMFTINRVWILPYSKTWAGDSHDYADAELSRMVGQEPDVDVSEIENKMNAFIKKVEDDGFPVEIENQDDLEMYARRVARKEAGGISDQEKADKELAQRRAEVLKSLGEARQRIIYTRSETPKDAKKKDKSPYYSKTIRSTTIRESCPKCGGSGDLLHYRHYKSGECFKCKGKGTVIVRAKEIDYKFDEKKWEKDNPDYDETGPEWWKKLYIENTEYKLDLHERLPAWQTSLSRMIFDLPRGGIKDIAIPIHPSIFNRLWPDTIRSTVFHLTDYEGLKDLTWLQGKKKSISAFYNIQNERISDGIKTEGGYVVELEADVLVAAPDDIASQPDGSGRRWIVLQTLLNDPDDYPAGMGGKSKLKGIENDINALLLGIITKHSQDKDTQQRAKASPGAMWMNYGKDFDNKTKHIIIKDYMDGIEKVMLKHSVALRSVFTDYVNKRTLDPDEDSGDVAAWDELIVNNFTIKMIHVGSEYSEDFEGDDV